MKKVTILTARDFGIIKTLVFAGLENKKIVDITERSRGTVDLIKSCETYEDYKAKRAEQRARRTDVKETKVEPAKGDYVQIDYEYLNSVLMGLSKSQENFDHRLDIIYGLVNEIHTKYLGSVEINARRSY